MAFSLSRRLCRSFLSNPTKSFTPFSSSSYSTHSSCNENSSEAAADVEGDVSDATDSVPEVDVSKRPAFVDRPLENGLDYGIYKVTPSFIFLYTYRFLYIMYICVFKVVFGL